MRVYTSGASIGAVLLAMGAIGQVMAATPITKTGDCPSLTRTTAASGDNWGQFPWKPSPTSTYPTGTIQNPLTAAQSVNCAETPEGQGLKVELWASEEMDGKIAYLQHFTFDERGRLWGVEPVSYPNEIRAAGNTPSPTDNKFVGGKDRIVIMEDTDGDKVMDKLKVFKDGLNMPQSIEVVKGGVIVTMGPYVAYFPNNNDVAGPAQILFSGMGPTGNYDTHGGINSLMYGLDNWVYGHTGYNACNTSGVNCGGGRVWRFRHTALGHSETKFEVWTTGPANAAGIGQTEDGQIFQSGATGTPHINHSIRKGVASIDIRNGTGTNLFYPITGDRYLWEGGDTGPDNQGWFKSTTTAVSGTQVYTSRLLPKKYWNRFAFECEGANKLCNQDSLVVSTNGGNTGSTWRAVRMPGPKRSNIIASKDAWFAPVLAKTGPDGAVWIMDWYNYLFLHNPATPSDAGGAWRNALRTKSRSRVWRVTPADGKTEPILNLSTATTDQLVATLGNQNFHWRLQAQRLLIEKGYTEALGTQLEAILTTDKGVDDVDNNPRVVHAIWTLEGMGQLTSNATKWNPILKSLLLHPAWGVRRNVLRAMPRTTASAEAIDAQCSVNDGHGHVRLQAMVALSEISSKPASLKAMWSTYSGIDTYASAAFTASGLTSAATKPCEPTLAAAVPYVPQPTTGVIPGHASVPRDDLRFTMRAGGFTLNSHGQLVSGEFRLYDLAGRPVFSSRYDAGAQRWSQPEVSHIQAAVYTYVFTGVDGYRQQGRVSVTGM